MQNWPNAPRTPHKRAIWRAELKSLELGHKLVDMTPIDALGLRDIRSCTNCGQFYCKDTKRPHGPALYKKCR